MYSVKVEWTPLMRALGEVVGALGKRNYPSDWRKCSYPYLQLYVQFGMTHHMHYGGF